MIPLLLTVINLLETVQSSCSTTLLIESKINPVSENNKFADLLAALKFVNENEDKYKFEQICFQLFDETLKISYKPDEFPVLPYIFFSNRKYDLYIEIISTSESGRSTLIFEEGLWFYFNISQGTMKLKNIEILGSKKLTFFFYPLEYIESIIKWKALFYISNNSAGSLELISCRFDGSLFHVLNNTVQAFFSLYYIEQGNPDYQEEFVLNFSKCEFYGLYYPKGIIYAQGKVLNNSENLTVKINFNNCSFKNLNSANFFHWFNKNYLTPAKNEYYDFILIINNTLLNLENSTVTDSSRFLLAETGNVVIIKDITLISVSKQTQTLAPPEFLYFIKGNRFIGISLSFIEITISSYNDIVNEEKDGPLLGFNNNQLNVPYNMEFERNQGFIRFCYNNIANLSVIKFQGIVIKKEQNMIFGIFYIENNNNIKISNLSVENVIMDTNSDIGMIAFIYVGFENEAIFRSSYFGNFEGYASSLAQILFVVYNNSIIIEHIRIQSAVMKLKASLSKVKSFYFLLRSNPITLFLSTMKNLALSNIVILLIANNLIFENSVGNNIGTSFGGILSIFFMNKILVNSSEFDTLTSEQLSNYLCFAQNNIVIAYNLIISNTKSNVGSIYSDLNNFLNITNCSFSKNIGSGEILDIDFYSSGVFILGYSNKLVLANLSIINSRSNIMGGAISTGIGNDLSIYNGTFFRSESANSNSFGGVIYLNISNKILLSNCYFEENKGYLGGVLGSNHSNNISIEDCKFSYNIALIGSVFYLEADANLTVNNAFFISNRASVSGGILYLSNDVLFISMNSCLFFNNQSPFTKYIIELRGSNNKIILSNLDIQYGLEGTGGFLLILNKTFARLQNITIRDTFTMEDFVNMSCNNAIKAVNLSANTITFNKNLFKVFFNNNVTLENLLFLDLNLENTAGSIVFAEFMNNISIVNISIINLTANSVIILFASEDNMLTVRMLQAHEIKLNSKALCFALERRNTLILLEGEFRNFTGDKNSIFLFEFIEFNIVELITIIVKGYLRPERGNSFSALICLERSNSLFIKNTNVTTTNENIQSEIVFFELKADGNYFTINDSKLEINNLKHFLVSLNSNRINFYNSAFHECSMLDDLIRLGKSIIYFYGLKLIEVSLQKEKYLLRLEENTSCKLKALLLHSNVNFVFLSKSKIEVKLSKINSCFKMMEKDRYGVLININLYSNLLFHKVDVLCRINHGKSIIQAKSSFLTFQMCLLAFNEGMNGGFAFLDELSSLILNQNKIYLNKALLGGVLFLTNFHDLIVRNNTFFANRAYRFEANHVYHTPGKGGCFYIFSDKAIKNFTLVFRSNKLILNGAEIGGVTYYMSGFYVLQRIIKLSVYSFNVFLKSQSKFYGNIRASYPYTLAFVLENTLLSFDNMTSNLIPLKQDIDSGRNYSNCLLLFANIDIFNQESYYDIENLDRSFKFNEVKVFFKSKFFYPCLYSIQPLSYESIVKYTNTEAKIEFDPKQFLPASSSKNYTNFSIVFKFRKCGVGESFDLTELKCLQCAPNFYSFSKDFVEPSTCKSCSPEPFFCYGGFNLTPKSSFWRSSPDSTKFLKCPYELACLGDPLVDGNLSSITILHSDYAVANPLGTCAFGFEGTLCDKCSPGYSKVNGVKCISCLDSLSIFMIILKVAIRVFIYIYMIIKAFNFCKNIRTNKITLSLVHSNFMIKIMIIHLQFLKTFLGFPFKMPEIFKDVFKIFEISYSTGLEKSVNIDCFFKNEEFSLRYLNNIITLLNPIIFVSIVVLGAYIYKGFQKKYKKFKNSKKPFVQNTSRRSSLFELSSMLRKSYLFFFLLIAYMLTYDDIISRLLENFSFINIGEDTRPDYRLIGDFENEFNSASHLRWLYFFAIPLTLLIGVFLPFFILFNIYCGTRNNLMSDPTFLSRFGYFIFPYSSNNSFYEFLYTLRRIFLIGLDIFFIKEFTLSNTSEFITLMIIMCLLFTSLSYYSSVNKPYNIKKYPILNRIELIFLTVQAIMCWSGSLMLSMKEGQLNPAFNLVFFIITLASNSFGLLVWVYYYWKYSVKEKLTILIRKIKKFSDTFVSHKKGSSKSFGSPFTVFQQRRTCDDPESKSSLNRFLKVNLSKTRTRIQSDAQKESFHNALEEGSNLEFVENESKISSEDQEKFPAELEKKSFSFLAGDLGLRSSEKYLQAKNNLIRKIELSQNFQSFTKVFRGNQSKHEEAEYEVTFSQANIVSVIDFEKFLTGSKKDGYSLCFNIILAKQLASLNLSEMSLLPMQHRNFMVNYSAPLLLEDSTSISLSIKVRYEVFEKLRPEDFLSFRCIFPYSDINSLNMDLRIRCTDFYKKVDMTAYPRLQKLFDLNSLPDKDKMGFHIPQEKLLVILFRVLGNQPAEDSFFLSYVLELAQKDFRYEKSESFESWLNGLRDWI